ncbi:MAG: hypothetical protein B7X86_14415 [Sphingobacteriales bacterium 17-39-43]|uniref:DUF262 domain-containing protein n=1 Tax=Daejeonella sp. TaxID=2805397 RepID=UPI000BCEB932|nr:DUF262 domain-containing protein [Daejeonella sp.]OYZ30141.1 MAG: hypothetical protein B7Y24_14180 [Sphingobacteriales bacterium 16-39-50]OZA22859.1 MAG: hypothetical protein B7X86_14415 [Sphingobacteriales bacterium 17-39-43]HQT23989.1 DUF262 domain-containing protein [Daejeonella sp.]HQT58653.1 DUF262 domain-containing protein [Daejeonella sp.]
METPITAQIEKLEKEISNERERLSSDRMDISFGELINLYKNQELIIRPEYQRLYRWNLKQKTALIESILLGIPIPPIFVAEDSEGVWELVDGLQRVSSFISFFGELDDDLTKMPEELNDEIVVEEDLRVWNKWSLEAGSLVPSLEDIDIDSLPNKYKINLKRAVCRVEILRGESSTAMKYELFKRLNSGGSKLTPQEIRNAIYRGINPIVNELLSELSKNPAFLKLTALSNQKKQELYDQELILRFIALLNNQESVNDNLENYLNHYMESAVKSPVFDKVGLEKIFNEVIDIIHKVGDEKTFRNQSNLFVPALFEGITIGVAQNIDKYRNNDSLLKERINAIKIDSDFKKYSGSASNSKSRVKNRLTRANQIFQE